MTGAARQQCPEGPATQSRPGSASAGGSAFRCCRTTGAGLRHFVSPGLSLSRASTATEGTGPSRRIQKGVYRQLPHSLIQRVQAYAATKRLSIGEVVSRALLVLLPRGRGRG